MKIAITGATGRLGTPLVEILTEQGHEVVEISRSKGVDVITGEGLAEALAGAEVIIDAATGPSPDYEAASAFFSTEAHNLQAHGKDAKRIVLISIIGVDRFTGGYNRAKFEQERAHLAGTAEVKILRAAQFHEFVGELLGLGHAERHGPRAGRCARSSSPPGRSPRRPPALVSGDAPEITEVGGPREESLVEAARLLAAKRGAPASVEGVSDPSDPDSARYKDGAVLPGPGATLGGPTFEEWLAAS